MDSVVSNSAVLHGLPLPPRRAFTCSSNSCATSSCSFGFSSPSKKLSFRIQNRRKLASGFRSFSSSTRPISITCGITEIGDSQFSDVVLKSDRPVLVEFVAGWCGPCRLMAPVIESIAEEYKEKLLVVKIDHDSNPRLIEEYKIYGLPALIIFKDGREVPESRREGAIAKAKLKEYVDSTLDSLSVA